MDFDFLRLTMALNWDSLGKSSLKTVNETLQKTLSQNICQFSQHSVKFLKVIDEPHLVIYNISYLKFLEHFLKTDAQAMCAKNIF